MGALPFQKHLDWLALENLSDQKIQKFYENIQFPIPTEQDIEAAREKVKRLPMPPSSRRNVMRGIFKFEDTPVFEKLGYGDLHMWRCYFGEVAQKDITKQWEIVGRMLNHPLMRVCLDVCIIMKMDEERVAQMLPQVFQLKLSIEAINLYRKNFANFDDFGREEWMDFLARIKEDNYTYTRYYAALTRPKDEVLHLCGLPTEKAFSDFLKNVLATSSFKFNYYMRQNTPDADHHARKWAKVGFEAGEKFEKYGASDVTDFAKLVQTEFEYVTPEIPTLDETQARALLPASLADDPQAPKK